MFYLTPIRTLLACRAYSSRTSRPTLLLQHRHKLHHQRALCTTCTLTLGSRFTGAKMTDPLYFSDTLLFVAEAVVTSVTPSTYKDCKVLVTLDKTIFHPQGGGQPADQGAIAAGGLLFNVQHVTKTPAGVIEHHGHFEDASHTTDSLAVGTKVNLNIDKERRILNARNHTAGHLLDYALDMMTPSYRLVGGNGYHFPDGPYVDAVLSPPVPPGTVAAEFGKQVEEKLNEIIAQGLAYTPKNSPPGELPERTQELLSDAVKHSPEVRVLHLEGKEDLLLPCGGTHTPNTAFIGPVTIRKTTIKANGTVRFAYKLLLNNEVPGLVF